MKFFDQIMGIKQVLKHEPADMFHEIIGHEELKEAFELFLASQESIAALQIGPPASSKTLFLLAMRKKYGKDACCWVDGGNSSGAGALDLMLDRKHTTHLLIDEIDGLNRKDQKALLNLFETGILSSVKVRRTQEREFKNLKVFATCNDPAKLSKALISRFFVINHKEYTEEQFIEIATKMFPQKDPVLCEYVAKAVWKVLGSKDIRDYVKIIKHSKDSDAADKLVELKIKYGMPKEDL